jgi:hypothetical protein
MGRKIFISYRRQDTASSVLGIGQYLAREFGGKNVFIDVDMNAGTNFPAMLEARLAECKVLIAVIGSGWLSAQNNEGQRCLDDPNDWVRLEIARALNRNITVIPVCVDGSELPAKGDLPQDIRTLVDHQAVVVTTRGFRNEMAGLARDIRAIPNRWPRRRIGAIAVGSSAACIGAVTALAWLSQEHLLEQLTSFLKWQRGNVVSDDRNDMQYDRLLDIVSGARKSACAADRSGSNVQLFENGWLLIRFGTQIIYAIVRTEDNAKIRWMSQRDDSRLRRASCTGVQNEQLLQYGFRYLYCNSTEPDLRAALGKPLTGEIGAWVQYQDWSRGLLAYGLPGSDAVRGQAIQGTIVREAFTQLVGVFMDNDDVAKEQGWKVGKKVEFTFHNGEPSNVYCTALWYPAYSDKPIPDDLRDRRDCDSKVDGKMYTKAHDKCLIFGSE